ncbi:MAG TPA: cysteine--tRNA ligase, partial [Lactococcus sp.]|nr:cysteine--tRNA ligase [Lactococcus sp.]
MLRIYNTLTRQVEDFHPIEPNKVKMYVCGPTVYNYIHIGNARSVVAFDLIRKYMEYRGFEVTYVSNFTDVDDKIIKGAAEEQLTPLELSDKYISAFYQDIDALNVKRASANPRATDYIDKMIVFIQDLMDKGFAYEAAGDVYFRVAKSKGYAKLANKNLEELLQGASGRI